MYQSVPKERLYVRFPNISKGKYHSFPKERLEKMYQSFPKERFDVRFPDLVQGSEAPARHIRSGTFSKRSLSIPIARRAMSARIAAGRVPQNISKGYLFKRRELIELRLVTPGQMRMSPSSERLLPMIFFDTSDLVPDDDRQTLNEIIWTATRLNEKKASTRTTS